MFCVYSTYSSDHCVFPSSLFHENEGTGDRVKRRKKRREGGREGEVDVTSESVNDNDPRERKESHVPSDLPFQSKENSDD